MPYEKTPFPAIQGLALTNTDSLIVDDVPSEVTRASKIVIGFTWVMLGRGVQAVLALGVLAILARLLSPLEFGLVGLAMIAVGFADIFAAMGVGQALVQRKDLDDAHVISAWWLNLSLALLLAGLIWVISPWIADFFETPALEPVLKVMTLVFPCKALGLTARSLLERRLHFRALVSVEIASYVVGYAGVGVVMALHGYGVWSLVCAVLTQTALQSLLQYGIVRHSLTPRLQRNAVRDLVAFGGWISLAQIAMYLGNQGDRVIIGRFLDAAMLGLYTQAHRIAMLPVDFVGSAVSKVLFPALSSSQDDGEILRKTYLHGLAAVAMLLMPPSLVAVLMAPEIVATLLGPGWEGAVVPLQIIAAATYFRASYKLSASLFKATGRVRNHAGQHITYAAAIIILCLIGQSFGISGVAAGVSVAVLIHFGLRLSLSMRILELSIKDIVKEHVAAVFLSVGAVVICLLVKAVDLVFEIPPWTALLAVLILGACAIPPAYLLLRKLGLADDITWLVKHVRPGRRQESSQLSPAPPMSK